MRFVAVTVALIAIARGVDAQTEPAAAPPEAQADPLAAPSAAPEGDPGSAAPAPAQAAPAAAADPPSATAQADPGSATPALAQADPGSAADPQPAPAEALESAPEPVSPEAKPEDKKKKKKKPRKSAAEKRAIATTEAGVFGVKGRVFTEVKYQREDRMVVDQQGVPRQREVDSLDIELDSARFGLLYQAPMKWLQAEVEIEIADPDQAELRDAYLLLDDGHFSAKTGNFKLPTSIIELESAFDLPIADRGFINNLLEEFLAIAGRAPGIQFGYEDRDGLEPKLMLGVFQGSVMFRHTGDDRDTELLNEANLDSQIWVARGAVEIGDFDVGVFFEHRVGSPVPLQTQHYPLVGADITYNEMYGDFGFRAWLDGHLGETWYVHSNKPAGEGDPWFLALRAILAGRYGGAADDEFFAELYTSLGMLDPDLDVTADWAKDIAVGVNSGLWDRFRVTLEGYLNDTSRNFPESYFGGPMGQRLGLTLQVALAF